LASAVQVALSEHVPGAAEAVTVIPDKEQAPEEVMPGVVPALLDADMTNLEFRAALAGAPVNLSVDAIFRALTN
jgi:hypothetical protein